MERSGIVVFGMDDQEVRLIRTTQTQAQAQAQAQGRAVAEGRQTTLNVRILQLSEAVLLHIDGILSKTGKTEAVEDTLEHFNTSRHVVAAGTDWTGGEGLRSGELGTRTPLLLPQIPVLQSYGPLADALNLLSIAIIYLALAPVESSTTPSLNL